ncbi:MAG: TetR/AcrR family transcriptional regulator [Phycisphaerales bacterium]
MPASGSPRKERERQRHRQEVLAAALKLFAERGFQNVSMQEIAAAAEFATGTLYNFFPSKEDLLIELLVAAADEGSAVLMPALDGPEDERTKLSRFIRLHERVLREKRDALKLYVLENQGRHLPGSRVETVKRQMDERFISRLSEVIAVGVDRGTLNDVDPVIAAKCLHASLEWLILAAVGGPQVADLAADLDKLEAVFLKGLAKP